MKKKWLVWVILIALTGLYIFFASPNLNPLYAEGGFFWAALITVYLGAGLLMNLGMTFKDLSGSSISVDGIKQKKFSKAALVIIGGHMGALYPRQYHFGPAFQL